MKRLAFLISMITLGVVIITLVIIVYWAFAPVKDFATPLEVLNSSPIGDKLILELPPKITDAKVATITMENDSTVIIPKYTVGQSNRRVMQIEIPVTVPVGRYRIFLKAIVPINPIRKVEQVISSEEFEITR